METIQISIKLARESFEKLQKAAKNEQKTAEELAAEIIANNIPLSDRSAAQPKMPGVALIKGDYSPGSAQAGLQQPGITVSTATPTLASFPAPEKLQKCRELQAKIKELSLLIETAEPAKKDEYLLQYALLTAELDSII